MGKIKYTRPKWSDINDLVSSIKEAENLLLKRREIFKNIADSDTASIKDKDTANDVLTQIDDICTDNKIAIKNIKAVVAKKTHLKPRAGIKETDQSEYLDLITKIDTRLSATGSFDEMLLQRLRLALNSNKGE